MVNLALYTVKSKQNHNFWGIFTFNLLKPSTIQHGCKYSSIVGLNKLKTKLDDTPTYINSFRREILVLFYVILYFFQLDGRGLTRAD